ncbi:MAG: ABC transporter permease [Asgard group archaeon]|nr:ABC transporter permease [Asgard group archaeon]
MIQNKEIIQPKKRSKILGELRAAWAIAEKRWRIDLRYPMSLLYFAVAPILWLLPQLIYGSALTGGRYSDVLESLAGTNDIWVFTSLGLVFNMFLGVTLWSTAYGIRREEWTGTFEIMYVAPISRVTMIFGNALKSIMHNGIGLFMQMGIIIYWYWGQFKFTDLLVSLLFLLVSILLIQGIAMILSGFVLWQKQGYRAVLFLELAIGIVTPVTYPLVTLPTYLQYIARGNPFTYGIEGFRNAILFGTNWLTFLYLGILLVMSLIIILIGIKSFATIEKILRKKGTIGQY